MKTIAFTGHRPDKLYGYDFSNEKYLQLKAKLTAILSNKIQFDNADTFITGGALGFDILAYDVVEKLKENNNIKHILAIPFMKQATKWNYQNVLKYQKVKAVSECIYVDHLDAYAIKGLIPDEYHPAKMQKRNEWMVDNCDILIACWDGNKKGGTYNCVRYAQKIGKEIILINPKTLEVSCLER